MRRRAPLPWPAPAAARAVDDDGRGDDGRGGDGGAVLLGQRALDLLMPMHLVLDPDGRVRSVGPTLARLLPPAGRTGWPFFDLFEVRRPGRVAGMAELAARAGERLTLALRGGAAQGFRGIALPLEGGGGLLLNLSFGIGVIDAVRTHGLSDADFAATDLALELLYLVEAKSAVTAELRELNLRLHGAKSAAEAQAASDPLTGLRNRRGMDAALDGALGGGLPIAVLHMDLDHFKGVNDTHGHAAGDLVLRRVARILAEETRAADTVARMGGDEFVLVLPGLTDTGTLARIAARLIARVDEPVDYGGHALRVGASIGIAVSLPAPERDAEALLARADRALYAAKGAGRGCAYVIGPAASGVPRILVPPGR